MIKKKDFKVVNEQLDELAYQREIDGCQTNNDKIQESKKEETKKKIKSIEKELMEWKEEWKANARIMDDSKVFIDEECLEAQDDLKRNEKNLEFKLMVIDRFNDANPNSKVPKYLRVYPENYKYKKK